MRVGRLSGRIADNCQFHMILVAVASLSIVGTHRGCQRLQDKCLPAKALTENTRTTLTMMEKYLEDQKYKQNRKTGCDKLERGKLGAQPKQKKHTKQAAQQAYKQKNERLN
eukprot:scaffold194391_cov14-Tisochrysis_lutea.AAC.1